MDDHFFDRIYDYASCWLIPRFREEYRQYGKLSACPSFAEIQDLCKILNIAGKWAFGSRSNPWSLSDFISDFI